MQIIDHQKIAQMSRIYKGANGRFSEVVTGTKYYFLTGEARALIARPPKKYGATLLDMRSVSSGISLHAPREKLLPLLDRVELVSDLIIDVRERLDMHGVKQYQNEMSDDRGELGNGYVIRIAGHETLYARIMLKVIIPFDMTYFRLLHDTDELDIFPLKAVVGKNRQTLITSKSHFRNYVQQKCRGVFNDATLIHKKYITKQ